MTGRPTSRLSLRATTSLKNTSNALWDTLADTWNPQRNPNGIVSLGLADNTVMQEKLLRRMNSNLTITKGSLALSDSISGSIRLKTAVARLMNRHINPCTPLQPSHIITTNGVTSAIEHCSWALCDPADGVLVGRPYYRAFSKDICLRPGVKFVPVSFDGVDPIAVSAVSCYEESIIHSHQQGLTIRAIMLCNPHNPLGRCYSQSFLIELMKLCQKYSIHLISDEIYALSVWRNGQDNQVAMDDFVSVLAIDTEGVIDPSLVHVLWGVSKDFGSNGVRLGVIISQGNPDLIEAVRGVGQYTSISGFTDHIMADVLEDEAFLEGYLKDNREQLSRLYKYVTTFLDKHGIPYAYGTNAALFVWCDLLTPYLKNKSYDSSDLSNPTKLASHSRELVKKIASQRLHLGNGDDFGCEKPGWFRITFSQHREQLDEGFKRIVEAITS